MGDVGLVRLRASRGELVLGAKVACGAAAVSRISVATGRRRCQSSAVLSETDVVGVLHLLERVGATAWVDGGWGVDALVGQTTRVHSDLDLVILLNELPVVRTALAKAGFTEILRDWLPTALAVADGVGREIDLHPITGSRRAGGYQLLPDGERFHYPAPTTGTIGGHEVWCVDAATQVQCHVGYEATEKDRRDMARLHAITGVALPEEYTALPPAQ